MTSASTDPKKYTPIRANQITMKFLQRDMHNYDSTRREIAEKFIKKCWNGCYCRDQCPFKGPLESAWELYEIYAKLAQNDDEKANLVGGVLLNCKIVSEDSRNTGQHFIYDYRVGGTPGLPKFLSICL